MAGEPATEARVAAVLDAREAELAPEEQEQLRERAEVMVAELRAASGGRELELLDQLTSVGVHAQRAASEEIELLRTRLGAFLDEGGASREVANGLRSLRMTLDVINPAEFNRRGFRDRLVALVPGAERNPMVRALRRVALRYETVAGHVTLIEGRMRDARELLVRDNVELRQIYVDVEAQQQEVHRDAYLGEQLAAQLQVLARENDNGARRDRIESAQFDVMMRVQDLRTMEEVHRQLFASLELTWQNNNRLGQAVDRTLTMATNLVTVGLALQAALVRQHRVARAAEQTREFLGDLVTANAAAINQHTREIGDLYSSPVIAAEKVEQAHRQLVEAMATAEQLRVAGIEAARSNVAQLAALSSTVATGGDQVDAIAR